MLTVPNELGRYDNAKNSCGVASNKISDLSRFRRFLIMGSSGTYYAGERQLTLENSKNILEVFQGSEPEAKAAVDMLVDISVNGKAPKNGPALFALAIAVSKASEEVRRYAFSKLPQVARIPTDLFAFAEYAKAMKGYGYRMKKGLRDWYESLTPGRMSYLVSKYQSREKWSHRRLFQLCHPKFSGTKADIAHWVMKGWDSVGDVPHPVEDLLPLWAFEKAKRATSVQEIIRLIVDYKLVRECIPTNWLNEPAVWEAMLPHMPMTAMLRNLATMTKAGLLHDLSAASKTVCSRLQNVDMLKKAKVHPISVLVALKTYQSGRGLKGSNTWVPVQSVCNALDDAFYLSFEAVEPTNQNVMVSVDVSGSMGCGPIAGMPLAPREVAACMAMVVARTEPNHVINGYSHQIVDIPINTKMRLDDVIRTMSHIPMGSTDCAQPILLAQRNKLPVDVFVSITDNEHNSHGVTPAKALKNYRAKTGRGKLAVLACQPTHWSIADPNDPGMLDMVGFSTDTPTILSEFIRGAI